MEHAKNIGWGIIGVAVYVVLFPIALALSPIFLLHEFGRKFRAELRKGGE